MELTAQHSGGPLLGDRIVKVNHAGEHGAVCIYSGQIFMARVFAPRAVKSLVAFRSHELRHCAVFLAELQRRGKARCRSYFLCGVGGYVLGVITGALGSSAIAATTAAVERVVLRHLEQQLCLLRGIDPEAVRAISCIIADEREHYTSSATQAQAGNVWATILTPIVSASTEAVIWLGMRV